MKIPELSYSFDDDERVYRETIVAVGELHLAVQAVTLSGRPDRGNQDALGFYADPEHFCAIVLDGAVSRDASHIARDLFEESREGQTAREIFSNVNRGLGRFALDGGASTGSMLEVTADGKADVLHVSDSWIMALFDDDTTRLLTVDQHEQFDEKALAVMVQIAIREGCDLMTARQHPEVAEALATMFRSVRNAPHGTGEGILNGDPLMDDYIQTLEEPLDINKIKMILGGSDGARFPYKTEKDPIYRSELFSLVIQYGLEHVVDLIHEAETVNPPSTEYPRWSQHDDKSLFVVTHV